MQRQRSINPRKGTETSPRRNLYLYPRASQRSINPRKGTETFRIEQLPDTDLNDVREALIPVRGRKLACTTGVASWI